MKPGRPRSGNESHRRLRRRPSCQHACMWNLPWASRENEVQDLFRGHGLSPVEVYVSVDRSSGKSRGYAFVSLPSRDDAARAIGALHGSIVDGRPLVVRPAAPRSARATR